MLPTRPPGDGCISWGILWEVAHQQFILVLPVLLEHKTKYLAMCVEEKE